MKLNTRKSHDTSNEKIHSHRTYQVPDCMCLNDKDT